MLTVEKYILQSQQERQKHLDLKLPCLERGGHGTQYRGVLAQFLDTDMPKVRTIHCCHACGNGKCSNPKHLYWGTASENRLDAVAAGHGWHGNVHKQSPATRRKIAKALKGRVLNPKGINGSNNY